MLKVNRIRFEKKGVETFLSPLEADVLGILWKKKDIKVRELHNILKKRRQVALTSVAVILDRLYKKGLVSREIEKGLGGIHYIYKTETSKMELETSIVENAVEKLIKNFGDNAINYFNERFSYRKKRG